MAEKEYKGAVLASNLSPVVRAVAEKWAEALNASCAVMYDPAISAEDRSDIQVLAMQTVAAFCAPFEPTLVERKGMAEYFLMTLNQMCEQYFQDKVAAGRVS